MLIHTGCLVDIFLKMYRINLSIQEKLLTAFVGNDKILNFKQKLDFIKLVSITMSLTAPNKDFSDEFSGDISKCDFYMVWLSFFDIYISL